MKHQMLFNKFKKILLITLGAVSLFLGFIGIFTPVLPTIPFLLLAAFFFSKGSPQIHRWLLNHKALGPPILDWEKKKIIRRTIKKKATSFIFLSWITSVYFVSDRWPLILIITSVLTSALLFIWTRKSEI